MEDILVHLTKKKMQKIPSEENIGDGSIWRLRCKEGEMLSDAISLLEWGSNSFIRKTGFKLAGRISGLKSAKLNKNPFYQFQRGRTYIEHKQGQSLSVVITI